MKGQQQPRRLPPLSAARVRRLQARIPLEILAAQAGVPLASLSRHERNEKALPPDALRRVEEALLHLENEYQGGTR